MVAQKISTLLFGDATGLSSCASIAEPFRNMRPHTCYSLQPAFAIIMKIKIFISNKLFFSVNLARSFAQDHSSYDTNPCRTGFLQIGKSQIITARSFTNALRIENY